ncbi:MAG: co-chaperone GroES [Gemmatimonadales bacterium]|jgi:chaperonin GroES
MAGASKSKFKITPLEDRVVILPTDEAESMRGGLYIPDTAKEKPTQGEVIAVGPGRFEKGARVPVDLKVGDKVIYGKYSGTPYTIDGDEVMIIKASDVLAKLG